MINDTKKLFMNEEPVEISKFEAQPMANTASDSGDPASFRWCSAEAVGVALVAAFEWRLRG